MQKQHQSQQSLATRDARSDRATPGPAHYNEHPLLQLQHTIGNQAVQRMLQARAGEQSSRAAPAPPDTRIIQKQLTINEPGDKFEQEADSVSEQVMRMPDTPLSLSDGEDEAKNTLMCQPASQTNSGNATETHSAPPLVHEVLNSGGGQPLDASTRAFMEPRFGRDFSQVQIHTGPAAEQSAREVQAYAYTVGNDIVFGAGQFAPGTSEGQRLLAHELTHVMQQSRHEAQDNIQRKEISGSLIRHTLREQLPPQDWWSLHREEWQQASNYGSEQSLNPVNTFIRAAWYNTMHLLPGEYQTVNERHDYYDLINYVIEHDPGTPKEVRDVRFFHAAAAVTGSPGIGSIEKPIGYIKLGPDTRQILGDVNVELFALNMGVIRNLLSNWKEPRDPQTPGGRISSFDFDIRMVETEQGLVENFITQHKARFTSSVIQEINNTIDPSAFGQSLNFDRIAFRWATKALGIPKLDFTIRDHRQAIGFAEVHIFHQKSEQDYLAFMKQRIPYVRPPNQYAVANLNGVTLNADLPGPLLTYDLSVGTMVEVINWSHMMGPYLPGDFYAGKVEVQVLDGIHTGKTGWTDFTDLR